jgi:acyl dehydratase
MSVRTVLNPARVGHRYPAYRFAVTRDHVRRYADATGHDSEGADLDQVAPPGFATCFTVAPAAGPLLADEHLGAGSNVIHASQEYRFARPIYIGDLLDCTPTIVEIVQRPSLDLLVLEVACVDARLGEPVLTSRGTYLFAR